MNLRNISLSCFTAFIVMILSSMSAWAHHSFAMFDRSKTTHIKGVVRRIDWKNPHVYFYLQVESTLYTLESASVNVLSASGWKPKSVKVGDKIESEFYPFRDGQPGGLMENVTLTNGTVLGTNGDTSQNP